MSGSQTKRFSLALALLLMSVLAVMPAAAHEGEGKAETGLFFVDYRNLNGGADGVLVINLDPDSESFGEIVQNFELGEGVIPHHVYYNHDQSRVYNTALSGEFLYELIIERDENGVPTILEAQPIDVGGSIVGEDMYFAEDGSRFWMTFMNGLGGAQDGTIGVFDAETNELIETISAPVGENPTESEPFILYPHGISANEAANTLVVTSTVHPDGQTGMGNTLTRLDMDSNEVVQTVLVAEGWDDLSQPVEVLMLRDGFEPYVVVTTITGGDVWIAPYDEGTGEIGEFSQVVDGATEGLGVALEFYIGPGEDPESDEDQLLYVSFAAPGVVKAYSLDNLPELEEVKSLETGAGAHHMAFFETEAGREALVVQNNLLNIDGINAGTLDIFDIHTGDLLATVDLPSDAGLLPESIEAAVGNGHFAHH